MQSEPHDNANFHTLRIATATYTPDTRRFFPLQVPEPVSIGRDDPTHGEQDDSLRLEFVAALDENSFTTQGASIASVDERSTLSAAQQIVACYRAIHDDDHEYTTTETEGRGHPQIPDDQHSVYTLAVSADTESTMDMMLRPKPKVHMRHTDQRALMQAQIQAIAMMHNAGLKPTNKIQCRRWGCADILPDIEALKYHLHIHNIADLAARSEEASPSAARKPVVGCSTSNIKALGRNHSRSKSSLETQHKCPTTYSLPRKLSTGSLLPSLFSPREPTLEVSQVPGLTTVANAFTPDPSSSRLTDLLPAHTRGRSRKESMAVSVSAGCSPSIAMLLSLPSSPTMHGHLALPSCATMPATLGPSADCKSDNCVSIPNESTCPVAEQATGTRSPVRALSPTRAMSPIRSGIKRILSMPRPDR